MGSKDVPLILEREGLPYSFKPYHLHDFLQKVSELLFESGAIAEPIRSLVSVERKKRRRDLRAPRDSHGSKKMFASREDYQMTEEELAEWERQELEETEKKKRAKPCCPTGSRSERRRVICGCEYANFAMVVGFMEKIGNRTLENRVAQGRSDFGERHQDEAALGHPRMRDGEFGRLTTREPKSKMSMSMVRGPRKTRLARPRERSISSNASIN